MALMVHHQMRFRVRLEGSLAARAAEIKGVAVIDSRVLRRVGDGYRAD
jgi:hypothetical protein